MKKIFFSKMALAGAVPAIALVNALLWSVAPQTVYGDAAPQFNSIKSTPPEISSKIEPTALGHLDYVQKYLNQAQKALTETRTTNYGDHLTAAQANVNQALADLKDAYAYVKVHPEANVLKAGPTNEALTVRPVDLPSSERTPGVNILTAVGALNNALYALINNPASDYHGPLLGDLGGFRAKIMQDIGHASNDLLDGIKGVSGARGRRGLGGAGGGFGATNAEPAETALAANDSTGSAPLQTGVAGLAMSVGLSLGGLHFFKRKKRNDGPTAS